MTLSLRILGDRVLREGGKGMCAAIGKGRPQLTCPRDEDGHSGLSWGGGGSVRGSVVQRGPAQLQGAQQVPDSHSGGTCIQHPGEKQAQP